MIDRKKMVIGAIAAVGTAGLVGFGVASAAPVVSEHFGIADKIATKFNLDKGEVRAVFEEDAAAHRAEMEGKFEERLSKAVADGKLTEDQKAKILAKHAEMRQQAEADHEAFKAGNKEEIRAKIEERHKAFEQWAKDNNIPQEYMFGAGFAIRVDGPAKGEGAQPNVIFHSEAANE